jgi:hypothetical protein
MNTKQFGCCLVAGFLLALAGCSPTPTISASLPQGLSIEEHALNQRPQAEYTRLDFVESTQEQILAKHAEERSNLVTIMDHSCTVDGHFGQCVTLGGDQLAAWADDPADQLAAVNVTVTKNGSPIYKIPVGNSSPIGSVRGLWVYGDHWALETAFVTNNQIDNEIDSQAVGQVSIDGILLNKQYGYQEAFGFQTLHGKPFYFFKQDGKIDISYNGVEIPTGYDEIPHYGCCSAATLNPRVYQNMTAFFARKGSIWYYIEIGIFDSQVP